MHYTATRQLDKAIVDVGKALELDPELSSALATDDDLAALRGKASWKRLFGAS